MCWILQAVITSLIAIGVAVAVPLWVEWLRRPQLVVSVGDTRADRLAFVHMKVTNRPMSERGRLPAFLGRHLLIARPADGCGVKLTITGGPNEVALPPFGGKWSSQSQPFTHGIGFDPEKLPGIHRVSLQPGDSDQVAIAQRERGDGAEGKPAIAFNIPAMYVEGREDWLLPPGTYRVDAQAFAGEIESDRATFEMVVDDGDTLSLRKIA